MTAKLDLLCVHALRTRLDVKRDERRTRGFGEEHF